MTSRRAGGRNPALEISSGDARAIWLRAQCLDRPAPFGTGSEAVARAVAHLGYVQIDTINVIERCHHHILFSRIPAYRRQDLHRALSHDKTVFEYWTHALSFVPVADFAFFAGAMQAHRKNGHAWYGDVSDKEISKVLRLIKNGGPTSIRDIKDDTLVDKNHPWGSRKPSKAALQTAFFSGQLTISERQGIIKLYELTKRHFGWTQLPRPASVSATTNYLLDRALRSQGVVSLESICHLDAKRKPALLAAIRKRVRAGSLVPVEIAGIAGQAHWAMPKDLDRAPEKTELVHILSPFDPLVIQRRRTESFFGYAHLFEAYVKPEKRRLGYFTLPVLAGDEFVAAIDLKADRALGKLVIQAWHWVGTGSAGRHQVQIDEALTRFERFQFEEGRP